MAVFFLYPRRSAGLDAHWSLSSYRGGCLVMAVSAKEARLYASGAFLKPVTDCNVQEDGCNPWMQEHVVAVREAPATLLTDLPKGGIIAPGHPCSTLCSRPEKITGSITIETVGSATVTISLTEA